MQNMEEILIPLIVFGCGYLIVKAILEYKTRMKLIEKGEINENLKYLYSSLGARNRVTSNIKWGMVLVGIGLALVLRQIAGFSLEDETIFGLMFIFAGVGFLVYYALAKADLKHDDSQNSR